MFQPTRICTLTDHLCYSKYANHDDSVCKLVSCIGLSADIRFTKEPNMNSQHDPKYVDMQEAYNKWNKGFITNLQFNSDFGNISFGKLSSCFNITYIPRPRECEGA